MKKRIVIASLAAAAVIGGGAVSGLAEHRDAKFSETRLPQGLTEEETVLLLVDYWNEGNLRGEELLRADGRDLRSNLSRSGAEPGNYSLREDMAKTEVTIFREVPIYDEDEQNFGELFRQYPEHKTYALNWENLGQPLIDDMGLRYQGQSFIMVGRESPEMPWRIIKAFSGA